jgi:putative FmdB family regulatory protein
MPLYDYLCQDCENTFDKLIPLRKFKDPQSCPECGGKSKKVLTLGHGGIQDDSPCWLDESIIRQLQDTDDPRTKRIETRTEYNKLLKDTGMVPTN